MNPSLLLIFGIGGFIFFAIIFVVGFKMMRDEQAAKEKSKNKPPESKPVMPPPQPIPVPMPPPPPMSTQSDNAHEVLRVLRDNLTGRLIVEIAGRRYERVGDIRDPDIGRGFVTTLKDLQKFMAGTQSPATPLPSIPEPQRPPEPPRTTSSQPLASTFGQPPTATFGQQPDPSPQSPAPTRKTLSDLPPIQKPSMNPFKQAKILKDMDKDQGPAPKSIPEQIDEILQERIARTPHRGRGCRVYLSPKGGVVFELDGKSYEGVGDVPDPEVQAIIRAAVAEWEKKQ
jgi:hypothetical protein